MKPLSLFESSAVKLTGWYLGIIMALSICMSFVIYHVSTNSLDRSTPVQIGFFTGQLPEGSASDFAQLRKTQVSDERDSLKLNLFLFNLFVLVAGGAISYALARRTLDPIEASHEAQAQFASDASHELKTPLTVMQSEIEVALRDPQLTKVEATELLKSNLEEVGKLRSLSDALLKLSSTNGQGAWPMQTVDLQKIAGQAIAQLDKAARAKQIKIVANLSPARVSGDAQSLTQLISIFLDNAIKYSPHNSQINLKVGRRSGSTEMSVTDTGRGIKRTDLPHIFDRFWRADKSRSKSQAGGYGLGLALAKQIAASHKAEIEVKSTAGKGSSFNVKFPAT